MRTRNVLILLAAVVVAILVVLSLADGMIVDYLWFGSLGYGEVFTTTLMAEVAIFAAVWVISVVIIGVSGLLALRFSHDRERLHVVRRTVEPNEVNLPELIRALGDRIPWQWLIIGAAAILALFVAQGEASSWDVYLKGFYGAPFGIKEPAFNLDVGFYVFSLPLLEELRDLFLTIIVLAALLTAAVYWVRGALDFRETPPQISPACAGHLSVLLGLFFLQRAMSYWIARFGLTLHTDGVVFGLRYVDQVLWRPGL